MLYIITVHYNEQGKKLTNQSSYTFNKELDYKPLDDEILSYIHKEIPEQLIESYTVENSNFGSVKVGDIVRLIITKTYSYGTDKMIDYCKVEKITDKYICIEGYTYKFDFLGKEITRKKKDIGYISLPTLAEKEYYLNNIKRNELIEKITELINDNYVLNDLGIEDLEVILEMIS